MIRYLLAPLLLWGLTGCADSNRFQRAENTDLRLQELAKTAITEEQKTARAALGYTQDAKGVVKPIKTTITEADKSPNPFEGSAGGDAKLVNELLNEAAGLGLIPNRTGTGSGDVSYNISLFGGPIVNSSIQINTGAASKQSGGSSDQGKYSLGAIARAAVNRIGRPVKTDLEMSINAGTDLVRTVAYPLAGAYVLKEGFRAAGDRTTIRDSQDSNNGGAGRTEDNSDNSTNYAPAKEVGSKTEALE